MLGLGLNLTSITAALLDFVRSGLKMWLPFSKDGSDGSTNSNNATLYTGKALSFDGINDYVDLGSQSMPNTSAATFAFWCNPTLTSSTSDRAVIRYGKSNVWFHDNNEIQVYPNVDDSAAQFTGLSDPSGKYQRFVVTISGTTTKLYIDGTLIGSETTPAISTTASASYIGQFDTNRFLPAKLSDVQLYDVAWTQADVTFDYENPQHLVTDNSASSIALSNLKGYWHLSEGAGSYAYNSAVALGSEEVTNGDFASDSDWDKGTGWTISGDTANCNNTSGSEQDLETTNRLLNLGGKNVKITFTVSNYSGSASMSVTLEGTGGTDFTGINANGTYSKVVTLGASENSVDLFFKAANGWVGSIDNVSIKEVSVGEINGATWSPRQATIPQLGLMDWSKPTIGSDVVTLIADPNDPSEDILGNDVRLREHSLNLDAIGYAQVADDNSLDFGTEDFSLEVWVKADYLNQGNAYNTILSLGDYVINADNAAIVSLSNTFRFLCGGNTSAKWIETTNYTQNAWTHLVAVRDSGTTKFYMNTTSQSGGESNNSNITNNDAVLIGKDLTTDRFYSNLIDDVRIYNRALSSTEVTQNYKAGLSQHKTGSAFSDDFSSDYGL